jgi:hypothetical protein
MEQNWGMAAAVLGVVVVAFVLYCVVMDKVTSYCSRCKLFAMEHGEARVFDNPSAHPDHRYTHESTRRCRKCGNTVVNRSTSASRL